MSRRKREGRESWRCTKYSCRKEVGYLKGTFFDKSHLTFKEVFLSDLFDYNIIIVDFPVVLLLVSKPLYGRSFVP